MRFIKPAYAVDIAQEWRFATVGFKSIGELISFLLPRAMIVAGIIFFILIILAGFSVITSAGGDDPHAQEKAKAFLTQAVIGLIIIFGAFWILQLINYIAKGSLDSIL
jgi:hypothetical protein